nr:immunoglobulin heavy chain junction region [Macaca mulatta]
CARDGGFTIDGGASLDVW